MSLALNETEQKLLAADLKMDALRSLKKRTQAPIRACLNALKTHEDSLKLRRAKDIILRLSEAHTVALSDMDFSVRLAAMKDLISSYPMGDLLLASRYLRTGSIYSQNS